MDLRVYFSLPVAIMCTYSNLPDDIIYDLCITAVDIKSLKELSAVDRRTRRIATPVLFRDVSYHAITTHGSPWKIFLESVEALLCAQEVSVAVRCVQLPFIRPYLMHMHAM